MNHLALTQNGPPRKSLMPNLEVGAYRLIQPLARGGMAELWAAEARESSQLGRTVAIKFIRREFAEDDSYAKMFLDEANVALSIEHPNVCKALSLDREHGLLYLVMEWVPGDSLGGMLRSDGPARPLELGVAVRIVSNALAGLHAAHEALGPDGHPLGVIHRDISPPNLLVSLQGQVKVSDFGIAKARHQLHERTKTGEVKGKFGYMAPEQITGKGGDRRIDLYAMGCVLYSAALGVRPFGRGAEAMSKILRSDFKRPTEVNKGFPEGLERILLRALESAPDRRFSTALEMRTELERWLFEQKRIVTQGDVAEALIERLPKARLALMRELERGRHGAWKVEDEEALVDSEPQTANTTFVQSRRNPFSDPCPADDDDATVRGSVRPLSLEAVGRTPASPPPENTETQTERKSGARLVRDPPGTDTGDLREASTVVEPPDDFDTIADSSPFEPHPNPEAGRTSAAWWVVGLALPPLLWWSLRFFG